MCDPRLSRFFYVGHLCDHWTWTQLSSVAVKEISFINSPWPALIHWGPRRAVQEKVRDHLKRTPCSAESTVAVWMVQAEGVDAKPTRFWWFKDYELSVFVSRGISFMIWWHLAAPFLLRSILKFLILWRKAGKRWKVHQLA